jgi:hypothetical protein
MKQACGGKSEKIYLMSVKEVERKEKVVTAKEIRRYKRIE